MRAVDGGGTWVSLQESPTTEEEAVFAPAVNAVDGKFLHNAVVCERKLTAVASYNLLSIWPSGVMRPPILSIIYR